MTRQERIKAFTMRIDGANWSEIGRELGYSSTAVKSDLQACVQSIPHQVTCIYPRIRKIIVDDFGGSARAFAIACGTTPNRMYHYLSGRGTLNKSIVETILTFTGLTYDEAFTREEEPQ